MNEIHVRIGTVPLKRAVRFHVLRSSPEAAAWVRIRVRTESPVLLQETATRLESDVEPLEIPGGWYAATTSHRFRIPAFGMQLLEVVRKSHYRDLQTHQLERLHDPLALELDTVLTSACPLTLQHDPNIESNHKHVR